MVEKRNKNRLIIKYFPGPFTKLQYIQGLEIFALKAALHSLTIFFNDKLQICILLITLR